MNVERLLTHYERIANTPEAINRLRHFILDLAVRGKLIEQDSDDEPVSKLPIQAVQERTKFHHADSSKKYQEACYLNHSTPMFELPIRWIWVTIQDIMHVQMGQSPPSEYYNRHGNGLPFYQGKADFGQRHPSPRYWCINPKKLAMPGDILISVRAPVGPTNIATEKCCIGRGLAALRPYPGVETAFVLISLKAFEDSIQALGFGSTFVAINKKQLSSFPMPLPPVAEQLRIVAKVDELMTLCDKLEAAREKQENTRQRLTIASLARLSQSVPETFQNDVRFALNALSALTTRADQMKQLRQTILNLAVRGKLVEQDTNDEPASELLERIRAEKKRRLKAGQIKKFKVLPELPLEKTPYALPQSWRWSQIADIGVINPRNDAPDDHIASFIPMTMITREYGRDSVHEVRTWGDIKKGYTHFAEGDVGLAKITPCFENGKSTIFRNLTGRIGSGTTELHIVRPVFVNASYILLFLKSPYFIEAGIPKMTGTAGQKRVPTEYFTNSPFPLPPLAEQHRIVTKVDKLMALCDRLETSLEAGEGIRHRLQDSLLHQALEQNTKEARVNT